jgi:hypothetical protein
MHDAPRFPSKGEAIEGFVAQGSYNTIRLPLKKGFGEAAENLDGAVAHTVFQSGCVVLVKSVT